MDARDLEIRFKTLRDELESIRKMSWNDTIRGAIIKVEHVVIEAIFVADNAAQVEERSRARKGD